MLKFIAGSMIVSFIGLLLIGGLFGVIPGISNILGATPTELGQVTSIEDSLKAQEKTTIQVISLPSDTPNVDGFVPEGVQPLQTSFDDDELTALSNNRVWKNFPLKNVQIRINMDNTIESSGIIQVSKAIPFAEGLGYSAEEVRQAMDKYKLPQFEIPYYIKGEGSVIENNISLSVSNFKIGVISIPQDITSQITQEATVFLENLINKYQEYYQADSININKGRLFFSGYVPKKINVVSQ